MRIYNDAIENSVGVSSFTGGEFVGAGYSFIQPPVNGIIVQGFVGIGTNSPVSALDVRGAINITGILTAPTFVGDGANITNLNATNLLQGTVPSARIVGSYSGITSVGNLTQLNVIGLTTVSQLRIINQLFDSAYNTGTSGQTLVSLGTSVTWVTPSASGLTGSGTINTVPKFTAGTVLGNSNITDIGIAITMTGGVIITGLTTSLGWFGPGTYISNITATNVITGTLPSSVVTGSYSGITSVGNLTQLSVNGIASINVQYNTSLSVSGITTLAQLRIANQLYDSAYNAGSSGQTLVSLGTSVTWVTPTASVGSGITGVILTNQVPFGLSPNAIQGIATFNYINGKLGIGTVIAESLLDINTTSGIHLLNVSEAGFVGIGTQLTTPVGPETLVVQQAAGSNSFTLISGVGNTNNYLQFLLENTSDGNNASAAIVAQTESGSETSNYVNIGINNSRFNQATSSGTIGTASDGYFYSAAVNNTYIGAVTTNKSVHFFAGGFDALNKTRITILSSGAVGVGTTSPSTTFHVQGNQRLTGSLFDAGNNAGTSGQNLVSLGTSVTWVTPTASVGSGITGVILTDQVPFGLSANAIQGIATFNYINGKLGIGTVIAESLLDINTTSGIHLLNVSDNGFVGIGTQLTSSIGPEALIVQMPQSSSSFTAVSIVGNINNYLQSVITNKSTGGTASVDVVAAADNSTELTNFVDMGINNSQYSIPGNIGLAGDAYFYSTGNDLYVGNATTNKKLLFFAGGGDSIVNTRMTILPSGAVGVGTTSPSTTFHVQGNQRLTGSLFDAGNNHGVSTGISTGGATQFLMSIGTAVIWQPVKRSIVAQIMTGYTPTGVGTDSNKFIVPFDPFDGTTGMQFSVKRFTVRLETSGTGISTVVLVKQRERGNFIGTSCLVGGLSLTGIQSYENFTTAFNGWGATCASDDKFALYFIGLSPTHTGFSAEIVMREL